MARDSVLRLPAATSDFNENALEIVLALALALDNDDFTSPACTSRLQRHLTQSTWRDCARAFSQQSPADGWRSRSTATCCSDRPGKAYWSTMMRRRKLIEYARELIPAGTQARGRHHGGLDARNRQEGKEVRRAGRGRVPDRGATVLRCRTCQPARWPTITAWSRIGRPRRSWFTTSRSTRRSVLEPALDGASSCAIRTSRASRTPRATSSALRITRMRAGSGLCDVRGQRYAALHGARTGWIGRHCGHWHDCAAAGADLIAAFRRAKARARASCRSASRRCTRKSWRRTARLA